jgi:hypothetical protein
MTVRTGPSSEHGPNSPSRELGLPAVAALRYVSFFQQDGMPPDELLDIDLLADALAKIGKVRSRSN